VKERYMDVAGVSSTNTAAALTSAATSQMGKDDFLLLLIAQLRNQDPLDPMDNSQFVAQLAQFSSLEQMENLNTKFEDQAALIMSLNNTMAVSYVGKEVVLGSSALEVADTGAGGGGGGPTPARRASVCT
jgi:flagellar basal-body rod modification protein FlgD